MGYGIRRNFESINPPSALRRLQEVAIGTSDFEEIPAGRSVARQPTRNGSELPAQHRCARAVIRIAVAMAAFEIVACVVRPGIEVRRFNVPGSAATATEYRITVLVQGNLIAV